MLQKITLTLLIVGILVNIIKGADLFLRPHQQKWLQDKVDALALWLDYERPLSTIKSIDGRNKLYFGALGVVIGLVYFWFGLHFHWLFGVVLGTVISLWWILTGKRKAIEFEVETEVEAPYRIFKKFRNRVVLSLSKTHNRFFFSVVSSRGFIEYLIRSVLYGCVGLFIFSLVMLLAFLLLYGIILLFSNRYSNVEFIAVLGPSILGLVLFWGFYRLYKLFLTMLLKAFVFLVTLILIILLIVLEGVLIISRGVVYRVAEYNKGAFAAILLFLTTLLGIIEIYLLRKSF